MSEIRTRLPAAERRASILDAAATVFGERGYAAATTDAIARVAGISQAYVVRTFGSKEALFVATAERAVERVADAFRSVVAGADDVADAKIEPRLGEAYMRLAEDRGTLVTLLHLFTLGHDPVIGAVARSGFLRIYAILRDEVGLPSDRATAFLGNGMLVSTLLALQLPAFAEDPTSAELLRATFRENTDLVTRLFSR
ncbi:TetR/AcrR family transcriptional regulator [Paramicrobacterium fandaimingii]|uniref:TetR/AcrR family transcriptional regulator n=1 Tax=Paramicrobacterium fandaimingii TaxID=2708079 RepID=UPI0014216F67|nr:TetR/AcrR family transcriptional regulator [Microbacterium fandaimingii]